MPMIEMMLIKILLLIFQVYTLLINGTIAWKGIFSDTYYQNNPTAPDEFRNLDGRPVLGTMNFHWNENDQGTSLRHGGDEGIHNLGYNRTIETGIKININNGGDGGYHLSRIGGEIHLRPGIISGGSNPTFDFFKENMNNDVGIINGSFDRGK